MKIPQDFYVDIKSKFPNVIFHEHDSDFNKGIAVEIHVDGRVERNGWVIDKDTDWQDVKQKAIIWLTSRYHS